MSYLRFLITLLATLAFALPAVAAEVASVDLATAPAADPAAKSPVMASG